MRDAKRFGTTARLVLVLGLVISAVALPTAPAVAMEPEDCTIIGTGCPQRGLV